MNEKITVQNSYRQIFKSTSIFGGVQIVTILIGIVKTKFAAVLLGPTGVGIIGLFTSTLQLINSTTGLGLNISAVRDISDSVGRGDSDRTAKVIRVLGNWVLVTGLLGMIITIMASSILSTITFNDIGYKWSFIWLSIAVLFDALNLGRIAFLRGMRKIILLAKAQIIGALAGLVASVPLYYIRGIDGIVPALVLASFTSLTISWYFSNRIIINKVKTSITENWQIGKSMLQLGVYMTLSSIAATTVAFVIKIIISKYGSIESVGFYQAGFTISATYLGLVFTAMSTDYFPKISSIQSDKIKLKELVNQQGVIALLFLGPLIITMLIALPLVINVLYSSAFLPVLEMTRWFLVGNLFKAGSWAISFVFLAKANGRLFLFNELGIKVIGLPLHIIFFLNYGITGLGYSFAINYLVYFIWVSVVAYKKYSIYFHIEFWRILLILFIFTFSFIISSYFISGLSIYIIGLFVALLVYFYSFRELDKRLGLKTLIKSFLRNSKRKK